MRCASLLLLLLPLGSANALGQTPQQAPVVQGHDGGEEGVMQSIFVPPIPSAPFVLTLDTDWSRPLAGGGTVTMSNERHIARDGRGRIYQERWLLVPKGSKIKSTMNVVQIMDPAQHTQYNCFVAQKTCELVPYRLLSTATYAAPIGQSGPLPDNSGRREVESLGVANTAGVDTTGTRVTTTINPGVLGNDRPMVTTREFWYSAHLGLNLISLVDNPQSGRQSFRAKDVTVSEPDPRLFELPEGYQVIDTRRPAAGAKN